MSLRSRTGIRATSFDCRLHLRPLAACLALAFSTGAPGAGSDSPVQTPLPGVSGHHVARFVRPSSNAASAVTYHVTTCDDPLPVPSTCAESIDGTLRQGFLCGQNGDTIDLRQLVCSKVTLSAPLVAGPGSLSLLGPGQDKLTIDAADKFRALVHNAGPYDGLYVNDLTIANGRYENATDYAGGGACIYSSGSVFLNYTVVSSCYTTATTSIAAGGAILAKGTASLFHATVTGGTASGGSYGLAAGGGIYAGTVELNRSTVSGNTAKSDSLAIAGGIFASTAYANYSTISGNAAGGAGGMLVHRLYLLDSTVSGNHSDYGSFGGIYARDSAQVFSSTIAGNSSASDIAAGLYVHDPSAPGTNVQNTIIANNKAGGVELDIGSAAGSSIPGNHNIIPTHQVDTTVPAGTITDDPLLGPLQDNGGPTRTLALKPGSPAINSGGSTGLLLDQRGSPRVVGGKVDIGAFEFDPDHIFANGFNL